MTAHRLGILKFIVTAAAGSVANAVRNCIQSLRGQETCFDERGLFLWQYLLHITGLRPIRTITCVRRGGREGPGSQAHMLTSAINFARAAGLEYVHTPFVTLHGADRPMQDWVSAWENLFNMGGGEAACTMPRHLVVNYCHHFEDVELCFGWCGRRRELAQLFTALIPKFRKKYYRGGKPSTADEVRVAINIRRGEVSATEHPLHYTPNVVVLRTTGDVKAALDAMGAPYRLAVYSNGGPSEFQDFAALGARVYTNPAYDPVWTMQELIESDVLIMAKSSFSSYASLISDGVKIFQPPAYPWWQQFPADDMIACRPDGSIDGAAFQRQISPLVSSLLDVRDLARHTSTADTY